ncbi:hypothetical protein [Xenorhabdus griffiniae]|uniref:Uncharacterized protein n=1 Tax=Xenorhabdus griffiniae TaxID=351672 RepID=A0ABY9XEC2_9GAMM|nr:hypothetical protein [Xenorhabdus griffiniae]MBD1229475.1 hypothetical protein [Xenorhabdus griffiniae]MBE8589292.1 hypothetical protein [Xenorhabdus griffiniae]WMV71269.1 hypothetical protein QL128_13890 [Xenorhabdus griffiniae]WNH00945.1 hypothetical protein QL112_013895 [Xenorhabdus griffiniae]
MPKHIHADLIMEYAKLAQETDKPWEYFQYRYADGNDWLEFASNFGFHPEVNFRLKPRTIKIGEYDVPEPVREPLKSGTGYHIPDITDTEFYAAFIWDNDGADAYYLQQGLIHLDRESAELHAKALIALTAK